jgi:hypothetical protein
MGQLILLYCAFNAAVNLLVYRKQLYQAPVAITTIRIG